MRVIAAAIFSLLLAACASSPKVLRSVTFSGDYIDAREDIAAKIVPTHKEPLRVPAYLLDRNWDDVSAVVAFIVETDGRTSEVQIVSTDDQEFAEAVCESVSGWRYAPAMKDGKPVRVVSG